MKEYDEKTVLIAAPNCSSVKLMGGLSTTKHIVTQQWLHACSDLNDLVPTSEYVVDYTDAIQKGECLRAPSGKFLLSGMSVHRIGTKEKKYNVPSLEELRDLVEVSGGEWVSTQRKAANVHIPDLLILMDDNDFDKPKQTDYIQVLLEKGATKICWCDLKTCLLAQSLEPIFGTKAHSSATPKTTSRAQKFKVMKTLHRVLTPPHMKRTPPKKDYKACDTGEEDEDGVVSAEKKDNEAVHKSPQTPMPVPKTTALDNPILIYSTEVKHLHRDVSHAGGDQNRGQIGAGIMNITKSSNTGLRNVQVFNRDGLTFQSEVNPNLCGFFGNAGRQNILGWDAYDTSGKIISKGTAIKEGKTNNVKEAHVRRFYFHFDSREHLTCVLFSLFGGDDNARKSVEEFFDGSGHLCPEEEPELPHRVIDHNRMDIDSINGLSPAQPMAPASRVLFDNDPQAPSQLF
jgi:hypothetical protein